MLDDGKQCGDRHVIQHKMFGGRGFTPSEQEQIRQIAGEVAVKKQQQWLEHAGLAGQKPRALQEDFIYLRRQREAGNEVRKHVLRAVVGAVLSGVAWLLARGVGF